MRKYVKFHDPNCRIFLPRIKICYKINQYYINIQNAVSCQLENTSPWEYIWSLLREINLCQVKGWYRVYLVLMEVFERLDDSTALTQHAHQLRVVVVSLDGRRVAWAESGRWLDQVGPQRALAEEDLVFPDDDSHPCYIAIITIHLYCTPIYIQKYLAALSLKVISSRQPLDKLDWVNNNNVGCVPKTNKWNKHTYIHNSLHTYLILIEK